MARKLNSDNLAFIPMVFCFYINKKVIVSVFVLLQVLVFNKAIAQNRDYIKKESKVMCKELKKQGWTADVVFGTCERQIENYFMHKYQNEKHREQGKKEKWIIEIAEASSERRGLAQDKARHEALYQLSLNLGSTIISELISESNYENDFVYDILENSGSYREIFENNLATNRLLCRHVKYANGIWHVRVVVVMDMEELEQALISNLRKMQKNIDESTMQKNIDVVDSIINKPQNINQLVISLLAKNPMLFRDSWSFKIDPVHCKNNLILPKRTIANDSIVLLQEIENAKKYKLNTSSNNSLRIVYGKDTSNKIYKMLEFQVNDGSAVLFSAKTYLTSKDFLDIGFTELPTLIIIIPEDDEIKARFATNFYRVKVNSFGFSSKITVEQYCAFLNFSGLRISENGFCEEKPFIFIDYQKCLIVYTNSGFAPKSKEIKNKPVNYVSWYGAKAFCNWYGKDCRLPTEAEYRYYLNELYETDGLREWCEDDYFNVWQIDRDQDQTVGKDGIFNFEYYNSHITQNNYYLRLLRKMDTGKEKQLVCFDDVLFKHENDSLKYNENYTIFKIVKEPRNLNIEGEQNANKINIFFPYIMRDDIGFRISKPQSFK